MPRVSPLSAPIKFYLGKIQTFLATAASIKSSDTKEVVIGNGIQNLNSLRMSHCWSGVQGH